MRNKFVILTIFTLTIVMLSGCTSGSYKTFMAIEKNTKSSMEMSYSTFDGYKYKTVNLQEGDELDLSVEINTKEGNLEISIVDESDHEVFKIDNHEEETNKIIQVEETGKYKIKVEGEHKGSYKINWQINKVSI